MIHFRSFRNSDPPAIAALWRAQPPTRGRIARVSPAILEQYVFANIYFDPLGLILAEQDGELIGFAHAGFGPTSDFSQLDHQNGVTCMLLIGPHDESSQTAAALLQRSEAYLTERGAQQLYAGAHWPLDPFYRGLYGGSDLPGILESDVKQTNLLTTAEYVPHHRSQIWQRKLADFRPPVNRDLLQIRRTYRLEATIDPRPRDWWEACQTAQHDQTRFQLIQNSGTAAATSISAWNMEPLASSWGVHAAGLVRCDVQSDPMQPGLEMFLLAETMKQLQGQGVTLVETQVAEENQAAQSVLNDLGFEMVDVGVVYRKQR